jgi:antitoxin ParD1/3/4
MNVNLTPALEKVVEKRVKTGMYNSPSEVVREALRLLEAHDRAREIQLVRFQSHLDESLASLDRGQGVDGESFMARLMDGVPPRKTKRRKVNVAREKY